MDGDTPPPPPVIAACDGDLSVAHRLVGLGLDQGLLQPSTRRVLAFPDYLTSSLGAMPVLELGDEGSTVRSVAVTGEVPNGQVYGSTYQPSLDRFVVLTWTRNPEPHYELGAVELTESEARFVTYTLVNPLSSDGFQIQDIYAISGDRIAMIRGLDTLLQVTIEGSTATFSEGIAVSTTDFPSTLVHDPVNSRLIGYGLSYDPAMPVAEAFLPRISTLSLETGGGWVEVPVSGDGPEPLLGEDAPVLYEPFAAYDPSSERLTVVHSRLVEDPFFPGESYPEPLLYAFDFAAGTWELVSETPGVDVFTSGTPWAVDPERHRTLSVSGDVLASFYLEGEMAGQVEVEAIDGTTGPRFMVSAAALPDGRVAATDRSGKILVLSTSGVPSWSRLGDAEIPSGFRGQGTLAYNPVDDSLLLFGGASTHSDPASSALHRIALDGTSIEELTVSAPPPPRGNPAVVVHGEKLYVAGGLGPGAAAASGDVWELDLRTLTWRQLATLPVGRAGMGAMVRGSELWFIGGIAADTSSRYVGTPRIDAVDIMTGAVREVVVAGAWPDRQGIFYGDAPLGDGYFTFDIGDDTIDGDVASLWLLRPDEAGGAAWTRMGSCLTDGLVSDTVGVTVSADQVWAVGENVLSIGL